MRVGAEEQRSVDALAGAVLADRLAGRDDVILVERRRERRAAMP